MPFIDCVVSERMPTDVKNQFVEAMVQAAQNRTGKPESYIMVRVEDDAYLRLGDAETASAFVAFRLVGTIDGKTKVSITRDICDIHKKLLGIDPGRVYVVFDEVEGANWGWNNQTFG